MSRDPGLQPATAITWWWCFYSFLLSRLPFSVFPFLFVLSFSVCFLYRLVRFSFRFPALLGGLCSFVSVLHPPPRCLRARKSSCSPCVLSSFLLFIYLFIYLFFSCFPFFDFDLDVVCFILSFYCRYYALYSVSVSVATRLAYDMMKLSDAYVRWSHLFIFVWGNDVCQLLCVRGIIFCFYLFSSWGNLPLQICWSLSCDHGLHCSDEFMWEQEHSTSVSIAVPLNILVYQ